MARWMESLARRVSQDPDRRVYEKDGRVYFADSQNRYGRELRRLSDAVLEEGSWGHKLSGDYVQQRILEILLELVDHPTGDGALPLLEKLSESLDPYDERRTVYVALSGVEMTDVDELRFGEIVLKKMTEEQKAEIAGGLDTEEDRERFLDRVRSVPRFEVVVSAEPIKAWEVAVGRLRDVLDLLRYSVPFLSDEDRDPDINLLGLNASSPPLVAVHDGKAEDLFESFRDLPASLRISRDAVGKMVDAGVFEAAKFAGKEEKTELERKALRGIQWASDSQGQREHENKLLSLIIALECLLPSARPSGTDSWTAEGAAVLLGPDLSARKAVRNRILGLSRSGTTSCTEARARRSRPMTWSGSGRRCTASSGPSSGEEASSGAGRAATPSPPGWRTASWPMGRRDGLGATSRNTERPQRGGKGKVMAAYRQGPYRVEEGYAMIDEDGEQAHQETFAETPEAASQMLEQAVGFERFDAEVEVWRPGLAVRVTDTNVDYRTVSRVTVMPVEMWDRYGTPYVP